MRKIMKTCAVVLAAATTLSMASCSSGAGSFGGAGSAFSPLKDYVEAFDFDKTTQDEQDALGTKLKENLEGTEFAVGVEDEANAPFSVEKPFVVETVSPGWSWHHPSFTITGVLKVKELEEMSQQDRPFDLKIDLYGVNGDEYCFLGSLKRMDYNKDTEEMDVKVDDIRLDDNGKGQYPNIPLVNLICRSTQFVLVYHDSENYPEIRQKAYDTLQAERVRVWPETYSSEEE